MGSQCHGKLNWSIDCDVIDLQPLECSSGPLESHDIGQTLLIGI
jgi:hypothetical protein